MDKPTIVCLTPVRNEAWILERFLKCASLWADVIILADQGSTDDTVGIARRSSKAHIINNQGQNYDEFARQELLIGAARRMVPGKRFLLALDADEMLTANFATSGEWRTMIASPPGTGFRFRWVNLCADMRRAWLSEHTFAWGFMDDNSQHVGKCIHSARVPVNAQSRQIICEEIMGLHYQYTDPGRLRSKHRWYQCFERVRNPRASGVKLFDQYHHFLRVRPADLVAVKPEWLQGYEQAGIDMTTVNKPSDGLYWWDSLVLDMLRKHGPAFFARENIWDDWPELARKLGATDLATVDPRTDFQKRLHRFLLSPASLENKFLGRLAKTILKRFSY